MAGDPDTHDDLRAFLLDRLEAKGDIDSDRARGLGADAALDVEIKSLRGVDLISKACKEFGIPLELKELKKHPERLKSLNSVQAHLKKARRSVSPPPGAKSNE